MASLHRPALAPQEMARVAQGHLSGPARCRCCVLELRSRKAAGAPILLALPLPRSCPHLRHKGDPRSSRNYVATLLEQHPAISNRHRRLFLGRVHVKKAFDLHLLALFDLLKQGLWDPQAMVLVMAGPRGWGIGGLDRHAPGRSAMGRLPIGRCLCAGHSCSTPVPISHAVNILSAAVLSCGNSWSGYVDFWIRPSGVDHALCSCAARPDHAVYGLPPCRPPGKRFL
jgi:hypothetical protein